MGNDGDQLLAEDIEGIAGKAGGLDVAFVHGASDSGAGNEIGTVFGEENALADGVDVMAGATDALHPAGHGGRSFDLNNEIDGAHIDAELEGGGCAESFDLAGFQLLLDNGALVGGEGAVMGSRYRFTCEVVEGPGEALGYLAAVDEQDGGIALADELEKARVDGVPDRDAAGYLRSRARGDFLHGLEAGHIFNRNFNSKS
jgi:hypothetical protein